MKQSICSVLPGSPTVGDVCFRTDGTVHCCFSAGVWTAVGGTGAVGIDGSIQFALAGSLAGNGTQLYWDSAANRMGIGTNSLDADCGLHIFKSVNFSPFGLVIQNRFSTAGQTDLWLRSGLLDVNMHIWNNGGASYIAMEGARPLAFQTNSFSRIIIGGTGDINLRPGSGETINVVGTTDYENLVVDDDDIPNKKYVDDSITSDWINSAFIRVNDSTFTVSDTPSNQAIFRAGRPLRYRQTAGTWRYGIVTNYAAGTVTLGGYPLSTSDDDEMEYGDMQRVQVMPFTINGEFADGASATLLETDLNMYFKWTMGTAFCVLISHRVKTADSGGTHPHVNLRINSNPVSTANANQGQAAITSWTDTVVDISGGYEASWGNSIEISTDAAGANNDAKDLSLIATFVFE